MYIVLALAARALMDAAYVLVIYPVFSHGYESYDLIWDVGRYVESWAIYGVLLMISPTTIKKPSDFYLLFMLFFLMLPILSLYALAEKSRVYLYLVTLSYVTVTVVRRIRIEMPAGRLLTEAHVVGICLAGIALTAGWMIATLGPNFNLSFADVYEYRSEASAALDVSVMAYLNIWSYKVLGPVLLTFAVMRRSSSLFLCAVAFHVLAFAYTQHKSVLFYPVIVAGTAWLFTRTKPFVLFPGAAAGMSLLALCLFQRDLLFWVSILFRRLTFLIANITFYYMEYFDSVGYLWWSNSFLSPFLRYPYVVPPATLVADSFGLDANFNSGFISTGYMHGGVIGLMSYSIVVGMLLMALDGLGRKHRSTFFVVAVTLVPMHSLILSADLLTSLLSHGLALAIVLLIALKPMYEMWHPVRRDAAIRWSYQVRKG